MELFAYSNLQRCGNLFLKYIYKEILLEDSVSADI